MGIAKEAALFQRRLLRAFFTKELGCSRFAFSQREK